MILILRSIITLNVRKAAKSLGSFRALNERQIYSRCVAPRKRIGAKCGAANGRHSTRQGGQRR